MAEWIAIRGEQQVLRYAQDDNFIFNVDRLEAPGGQGGLRDKPPRMTALRGDDAICMRFLRLGPRGGRVRHRMSERRMPIAGH
jgi:hypothetical protein